ncbi:hypothetical protein MMC07_006489 [Pseudocyphellaria aurata]|nr:hypothetical protein [Pseudocyphellaria aurata]
MGGPPYPKIVQKLIDLLKEKGRYDDLQKAVEQTLKYDIIEMRKLGIFDADSFLDYIDDLVTNWVPTEDIQGRDILYRIELFYFIFDQDALKDLQSPIDPKSAHEPLSPLSSWLVEYAKELGTQMDQEGSLTARSLETFNNSPSFNIDEYIIPRGGWRTFNDFFARSTKPGYRPIASLCDSKVIVSPADSTFDECFPVSVDSKVNIKNVEWDIHDLLSGSKYAGEFEGGIFTHQFLNTFDYHRQHTPVDGTVIEARIIPGQAYLEVVVHEDPDSGKTRLKGQRRAHGTNSDPDAVNATVDAPDSAGYQFLQCRGLVVIDNPVIGKVAVLPIGMAQVSSVILTAEEGKVLRKGEEISYFQFGGSDIVVVFQKRANVTLSTEKKHYKMGEQIGTANPAEK